MTPPRSDPTDVLRTHVALWSSFVALAVLAILSAGLLPFRNDAPLLFTLPAVIFALSGPLTWAIKRGYSRQLAAMGTAI